MSDEVGVKELKGVYPISSPIRKSEQRGDSVIVEVCPNRKAGRLGVGFAPGFNTD